MKPIIYLKARRRWILFFKIVRGFCVFVFWRGEGTPGVTADQTFVVCQIGKFIALFVNTSISVNKILKARSGRATYLKRESSRVRITRFR